MANRILAGEAVGQCCGGSNGGGCCGPLCCENFCCGVKEFQGAVCAPSADSVCCGDLNVCAAGQACCYTGKTFVSCGDDGNCNTLSGQIGNPDGNGISP